MICRYIYIRYDILYYIYLHNFVVLWYIIIYKIWMDNGLDTFMTQSNIRYNIFTVYVCSTFWSMKQISSRCKGCSASLRGRVLRGVDGPLANLGIKDGFQGYIQVIHSKDIIIKIPTWVFYYFDDVDQRKYEVMALNSCRCLHRLDSSLIHCDSFFFTEWLRLSGHVNS